MPGLEGLKNDKCVFDNQTKKSFSNKSGQAREMLELKNIVYHPATSESPVLKRVNLKCNGWSPIIVAGPSGSGKTSLIEVISGLSNQQSGEICWDCECLKPRERRLLCGVVFQFPERHFLGLNVAQELRLGHKRISSQMQLNVLKKVGLEKIDLRQAPEQLSGGQQRRLALAVQMLRNPRILLLDEPTAGLDWSVRGDLIKLLSKLVKDQLLLIVTHEPKLFEKLQGTIYNLEHGRLVEMKQLH